MTGTNEPGDSGSKTTPSKETKTISTDNYSDVESLSVKIPTFWTNSPDSWFAQVEAQFTIGRVQKEERKYAYVLAALPCEVIDKIMDVIQSPPTQNMYQHLKRTIIGRLSATEEQKLNNLLFHAEMGDKNPSEFYRFLIQLGKPSENIGMNIVKNIWLKRIPKQLEIALIPVMDKNINDVLTIADNIHREQSQLNIYSVHKNTHNNTQKSMEAVPSTSSDYGNSTELDRLKTEICEIKHMLAKLSTRSRSPHRPANQNRRRSTHQNRSRSRHRETRQVCWYHTKYGYQARKCIEPCILKSSVPINKNDDNIKSSKDNNKKN